MPLIAFNVTDIIKKALLRGQEKLIYELNLIAKRTQMIDILTIFNYQRLVKSTKKYINIYKNSIDINKTYCVNTPKQISEE